MGTPTTVIGGTTYYKTACAYYGTELTNISVGSSNGNVDSVLNAVNPNYFAAIPNFGQGANCGLCVQITYGGKSIIATVVDNYSIALTGHLNLSVAAFAALVGTNSGDDIKSGVTWKSVLCPATGNIICHFNGTYSGQLYFENAVLPIASASVVVNGTTHTGTLSNGFWDFGVTIPGNTICTLTDIEGRSVNGTIPASDNNGAGASIGVQFPLCQ